MNNLDRYVEEKIEEFKIKNYTDELDIIRNIYLDLGNRFSFDTRFLPFGDSETRTFIYEHSKNLDDLNRCMITNKITCVSAAYILEYILKKFDIDIKTIIENCDAIRYNHAYNFIKLKDGRKFCVDLQKDIKNIQTNSYTSYFGFESYFTNKYIITRQEVKERDIKEGYITKEKGYSNEYIDLLHTMVDGIDNLKEKAKIILENIDAVPTNHMGYTDRQWHHVRILRKFFSNEEFDFENGVGNITLHNLYKDINGKRKYISVAIVIDDGDPDIYFYNKKENGYRKININNYVNSLENGLKIKTKEKIY